MKWGRAYPAPTDGKMIIFVKSQLTPPPLKKIYFTLIAFVFVANLSAQMLVEVNSAGVGIGTTNPQFPLDVNGDARVIGGLYLGGATNQINTTNNVAITFKVNNNLAGFTGNYSSPATSNVSFGYQALNSQGGGSNAAFGNQALYCNTTGNYNTANGVQALFFNTTGNQNTAIGFGALYNNKTGNNNIAIGNNALWSNNYGSQNIVIGYMAYIDPGNLNNAIVIGNNAVATASNQVMIGNSSVTSIGGYASWSTFSDGRSKKNIQSNVPGLAFINRLQPVTYNLNLDAIDALLKRDQMRSEPDSLIKPLPQELIDINKKARESKEKQLQTGFVAQDVEAIAKSIGYNFSGVEVDELGIYSLRYGEFVVPLVKAVQELSEQNDRLQKQVNELTVLVNKLLGTNTATNKQDN